MKIPLPSSRMTSFHDMIPLSPTPSDCSTDTAEALFRDLVDIYGEAFVDDPKSVPLPVHNVSVPQAATSQAEITCTSEKSAIGYHPMSCTKVPAQSNCSSTVSIKPVQPSTARPAQNGAVSSSYLIHSKSTSELPRTTRTPEVSSYPSYNPPVRHEPSLMSDLATRCNPLHKVLQEECKASSVPLSLIQASSPSSDHITPQIPLAIRCARLHVSLQNILKSDKERAEHLLQFYKIQSARIESDRVINLCKSTDAPTVLPIVNQYFDMQQHALIDNIEMQIHCLLHQFLATTSSVKQDTAVLKNRRSPSTSTTASDKNNILDILNRCTENNQHQKKSKPNPLNSLAVRIMNNWYERNHQNPYPSNETAEVIGKAGNITAEQVKKWFANKRMRSSNTKPQKRRRKQQCSTIDSEITQASKRYRSTIAL